jgi:hypothetical protein
MSAAASAKGSSTTTIGSTAPIAAPISPVTDPPGTVSPTTTGSGNPNNWTTTESNLQIADELNEIINGQIFEIPNNYREIRR